LDELEVYELDVLIPEIFVVRLIDDDPHDPGQAQ